MQIIRQKKILYNVLFILFNSIITYEMDLSKAQTDYNQQKINVSKLL